MANEILKDNLITDEQLEQIAGGTIEEITATDYGRFNITANKIPCAGNVLDGRGNFFALNFA